MAALGASHLTFEGWGCWKISRWQDLFFQLTNKADVFFSVKKQCNNVLGGDYPLQDFFFFTPFGSGTHLKGNFLNKEHPAFLIVVSSLYNVYYCAVHCQH